MAGAASEDAVGTRPVESFENGHHSQSEEALVEWRSSDQVENGTPSTSPLYWETDDEEETGPKPSELYGKHTWKIEKFSQLNKRELRSNAFEVGGYKWYILIYPQGCDVCNHLSLFLCVANHDKLNPGWSHFAQFTIAVVNKDPKKSKYSDTLHRFWKKEHDWGWKKFMELSKVLDGFIDADTLIIKAQVQVIRERANRPFRCLDSQYRRELVRVYLTNVDQMCQSFVEERRSKLRDLTDDKATWLSFRAFWLAIDQNTRRCMSRERTDAVLKVVVKHFFIEKEVTSTLVMDSLYSGLKALVEGHNKSKKGKTKLLDAEEIPAPIVYIDNDAFVLVDDILSLLERAAKVKEPSPPKYEKGPQNRTKDGSSGEDFNKDSIERDERRLTELGRRTLEIFILAHIFSSKIEVAYKEAVALQRQEELIREEEAAWHAESELKARRLASGKDKKSKKKQAKQKRNNRKGKDKRREERTNVTVLIREQGNPSNGKEEVAIVDEVQIVLEKSDFPEAVSDVSDSVDGVSEVLQPDSEDRDVTVNWDTDASEVHPLMETSISGIDRSPAQTPLADKKVPVMDDSFSTCSTDSVPSVVMNLPYKETSFHNYKKQKSPSIGKNQQKEAAYDRSICANEVDSQLSQLTADKEDRSNVCDSNKSTESVPMAVKYSLHGKSKRVEQQAVKKEGKVSSLPNEQVDMGRIHKDASAAVPSSPQNQQDHIPPTVEQKSRNRSSASVDPSPIRVSSSTSGHQMEKTAPVVTSFHALSAVKSEAQKSTIPKPTEKATSQQAPMMSRPSSAPLIPGPRATAPVVNVVHTSPLLARSVSAAGRLGPDPAPATHSYAPQSYRNAIMGNHVAASSAGYAHMSTSTSGVSPSSAFSVASAMVSSPMFVPHNSERLDPNAIRSSFPFGMVAQDVLSNSPQWAEGSQREAVRSMHYTSLFNGVQNLYKKPTRGSTHDPRSVEAPACTSGRQLQGFAEDFPHLDIINDLLDDENVVGISARDNSMFQCLGNGPSLLDRQFSLPSDMVGMAGDVGSTTTSCRFERTRSYHDVQFERGYSSPISRYEQSMDFIPQSSQQQKHLNGQIDGMIPNWRTASDLSIHGTRTLDFDGYQYLNPDYSNMVHDINGYNVFQPSDGN